MTNPLDYRDYPYSPPEEETMTNEELNFQSILANENPDEYRDRACPECGCAITWDTGECPSCATNEGIIYLVDKDNGSECFNGTHKDNGGD